MNRALMCVCKIRASCVKVTQGHRAQADDSKPHLEGRLRQWEKIMSQPAQTQMSSEQAEITKHHGFAFTIRRII